MDTLESQLRFLVEVDRLKGVLRRTRLADGSRYENSAEHSWHLALAALTLAGQAPPGTDIARVVAMLLVHDLVEIDAGDTFAYSDEGYLDKEERERLAADRLFALLPEPQGSEFRALWEEFEAQQSEEARFATALDRLQPILLNLASGGGSWAEHHISTRQLYGRMAPLRPYPALWAEVERTVALALARGHLWDDGS